MSAVHDQVVVTACPRAAEAAAVPVQHLRAGPAVQLHQVTFGAAAVQPGVAEVVPEPVRVHGHAGLLAAPLDHLVDPVGGQRPAPASPEPQPPPVRLLVPGADPQVPVQAARGLVIDPDGPVLAALPADADLPPVQVQVAAAGVAG